MKLKTYDTKQQVAEEFANYFKEITENDSQVHIALSGGSTPKIVFDHLAKEYKDKIDWSKIHLYWGDERCVLPTDPESNYKMTASHLLTKVDIPAEQVYRIRGEELPANEAVRYGAILENKVPGFTGVPRFDLVILGMGDDGHTASIFPHEIGLWDAQTNCEVATHPDSGQKRITITGKIINNAKNVAFLVTGGSKAEKVKAIINKETGSTEYPASLVNPKSGNLSWFLDKEAAAGI